LKNGAGASASSTRAVFGGGYASTAHDNTIDYVTIASTGNATYFGDLAQKCRRSQVVLHLRGIVCWWLYGTAAVNAISYVTIASTGNATSFGALTGLTTTWRACASDVRGVFGGGTVGGSTSNVISYVTIASTGKLQILVI